MPKPQTKDFKLYYAAIIKHVLTVRVRQNPNNPIPYTKAYAHLEN
jgi:hypothetical protein